MKYKDRSCKLYTAFIKKLCFALPCLVVFLLLIPKISAAADVTIGTGSDLYKSLPVEPYYNFTYSQTVYLKTELNLSSPVYIDAIEYQYNGYQAWSDEIKVYAGHTTQSSFSTWKAVSTMTQVYSGYYSVNASAGWYRITFSTPYYYNNTDNLAIAVDENTATYHSNCASFLTTNKSAGRSIYYYNDATNPDPASPPTGTLSAYIANIKIIYHLPPPEDYNDWNYSKVFQINTTSAGVPISADVTNFPLCVRLSSSNFDFAQAKTDGSDIRFAKSNGDHLNYEISRWDATNGKAVLWVLMDNVYANNEDQSIIMYWGKSDATSKSSPETVFDQTNYKGAWHLDNFTDATANHNHGTNYGTVEEEGIVGKAKKFDGTDDYIQLTNNCMVSGTWTLDFWVKPNSPNNYARIFTIGNTGCSSRQIMALWHTNHIEFRTATDGAAGNPQVASGPITTGVWTHVLWSFDGTTHSVYVNGVASTGTVVGTNVGIAGDLFIGRNTSGNYWNGSIDEVRVSATARAADWAALTFDTQGEGASIIQNYSCPMNACVGDNVRISGNMSVEKEITLTPSSGGTQNIKLNNFYNYLNSKNYLFINSPGGATIHCDNDGELNVGGTLRGNDGKLNVSGSIELGDIKSHTQFPDYNTGDKTTITNHGAFFDNYYVRTSPGTLLLPEYESIEIGNRSASDAETDYSKANIVLQKTDQTNPSAPTVIGRTEINSESMALTGPINSNGLQSKTILYHNTSEKGEDGMQEGFRIRYEENFLDPTTQWDDVLVFEKTDAGDIVPDGGIAFVNSSKNTIGDNLYRSNVSMYIKGNGNIGINTITPNEKLEVAGTVKAEKFKVGEWSIETPDYVFNKDYYLRPLKEIEEFIKENKRLPEVQSAEEMKKGGVDLAELNMTLLKKVEELHLYILLQQKEIENIKKEVEELKK